MKAGTKVKMSEELKALFRANCIDGKHVGPMFDEDCYGCCGAHVDEFGDCVGIVVGPIILTGDDLEVEVRWQPSNLRYGYDSKHLVPV